MGSYAAYKAEEADVLQERVRELTERVDKQRSRIVELEAAVDSLLGHARCEDDCDRVVALRAGRGRIHGGPGGPCVCGNQDAVRSAARLLDQATPSDSKGTNGPTATTGGAPSARLDGSAG